MRRRPGLFVLLALALPALVGGTSAFAVEARLPRHPAPSPDGSQIAFSWQGDLWTVPAAGGAARRLTAHPAADRYPIWSRDGRMLAFASDRHGHFDVFVMPADGSAAPRRLTYASSADTPLAFTRDGRRVLFGARRDESIQRPPALYTVSIDGGSAELAQDAVGHAAAIAPDGVRVAFVRGGTPWTRRGYRGAANRELWLRDAQGAYARLTEFDGDDDNPSWLDDGRIVFLSAREGRKNVFMLTLGGGAPVALTRHDGSDVRFPRASADGSLVAYEFEDAIWTVAPNGGTPRRLAIDVPADLRSNPLERRVLRDQASELALSPDGKTAAFIAGGDVFVVAVRPKDEQEISPPPTVRVTDTPAREIDLSWSPDGGTLLFSSAAPGQYDLTTAKRADAKKDWTDNLSFVVAALTSDPAEERAARYAPDGATIAFIRGGGDLWLVDADGRNPRALLRHFSAPDFEWSPDGKYLAYAVEDENSNSEIYIHPIAGGERYNVSRHPDEDSSPRWSPDGRRLLWLSRRHADSMDVWGVWLARADHERTPEEWLRVLRDEKKKPAAGKDEAGDAAKKPEGDKTDAAKKPAAAEAKPAAGGKADAAKKPEAEKEARPARKLVPVTIDFDRLWERAVALTTLEGNEGGLLVADGGKRIVFSAEHEGERDLYSIRWDGKDIKKLTTGGRRPVAVQADSAGTTVFFLDRNGTVQRVGLDAKPGDAVPFAARQEIDQEALRAAVFNEAWRVLGEAFYDPAFHGVDWKAQHDKYRPWAMAASSPEDFSDVMNLLFDELNASHLAYRPRPATNVEQTGMIGALYDPAAGGPGILVREVLADSPAARVDVGLKAGERLLAVNGDPVRADLDVHALFADTVGQRTTLSIRGADGKERSAVVVPITLAAQAQLRYATWIRERRALVDKLSGGRLGYIHIQAMDMPSFEKFEHELYAAAAGKEGLVIDVRANGGGFTTDYLLAVLMVQRHAWTVPRGADPKVKAYAQDRLPLAAWTRPAITLCNEESYSNAEIFSHAFKTLKRGKLVGAQTFGAVISTGGATMLDGALVRLPGRGWYVAGSGINQENNGAVPDIAVAQPPSEDLAKDRDAQLARAVEELLRDLPNDPRRGAW